MRQSVYSPKLHLPTGSWARFHSSSFGGLCCVASIYLRVAKFNRAVDTSEVAQAALRLSWPQISAE
jgi:hypothetical protein